jgi:hypothetical protein
MLSDVEQSANTVASVGLAAVLLFLQSHASCLVICNYCAVVGLSLATVLYLYIIGCSLYTVMVFL